MPIRYALDTVFSMYPHHALFFSSFPNRANRIETARPLTNRWASVDRCRVVSYIINKSPLLPWPSAGLKTCCGAY